MSSREPKAIGTLHVVSTGGVYGIENMLLNLLPELAAAGDSVAMLCLDGEGAALVAAARARGIRVAAVDCGRPITPLGWASLARYLLRHRPRRVHVHGYKATILAGTLSLVLRQCVIVTYHGLTASLVALSPSLRRYVIAEGFILRRAAAVVAVSPQIRDELLGRGVAAARTRVVLNGVSASEEASPEESLRRGLATPELIAVGRLAREKNFDVLIRALPALRSAFPTLVLRIAGDGPLRTALAELSVRKGVVDSVQLLGFVADVRPLLARATCFVMPSQTEGMPMALLEAMSLGCPIVASRVGGIPEMVRDGREAILVPPGDQSALVQAVKHLLASASERERLGEGARRRYEAEFTARAMAREYIAIYRSMCSK